MRNLTLTLCLTVAVLLGSAKASYIDDYTKGLNAAQSGDFSTALREWTTLAEQGDSSAQFNLGVMYEHGRGVPKDDKTAEKWYRLAAKQGVADAQFNLGVMYGKGRGVPKDDKTAEKWYRLAAKQGDAKAQINLGIMYIDGRGVIKDVVYAHMWVNIGASNGAAYAGGIRDFIEKRMTSAQIAEAQKLARECVRKKYKGC